MQLRVLAYTVGVLPVLTAYVCYLIAVQQGHVPSCIPNLEGCTSISSTGRHPPESLLFRGLMIPSAVLMALYWYAFRQWLVRFDRFVCRQHAIIFYLGLISSLFLVVYATALGQIGEAYAWQRRIGVVLFFSCSLIAQLLATNRIWKQVKSARLVVANGIHKYLLLVCLLMMVFGLSITPLAIIFEGDGRIDNIIEWNYAVLMYAYYFLTGLLWSATDFRLDFKTI